MAQPYVGEIRMFGGNFAPLGWMFCEGQVLPISENETLFNLIGTTYGGDGQTTFALPDLRGRLPIHQGGNRVFAERDGAESVTLAGNQMPQHTHSFIATKGLSSNTGPTGHVVADSTLAGAKIYAVTTGTSALAAAAVTTSGGSQPHENRMPFLAVSFIISLFGVFPSQT
jgi:microcystin-dependent protein